MVSDKILNLLRNRSFRKLIHGYAKPEDIEIITRVIRGFDLLHHIEGLSKESVSDVMKIMEEENIIEKVDIGNAVSCPYCGNINLFEYYRCPRCASTDIKKIYMVQHKDCGKVFTTETLKIDKCPKCGKPISSIDELDLIGGLFKCLDCGETFEHPDIRYKCSECGAEFTVREAKVSRVYGYRIRKDSIDILRILFAYDKILQELSSNDYNIEMPGKIVGESGVTHEFPLIIRDNSKNTTYSIDVAGLFGEATEDYILKNFLKIADTPNVIHIYVAKEDLKKKFNIPSRKNLIWVVADNLSDALVKIKEIIKGGESNG